MRTLLRTVKGVDFSFAFSFHFSICDEFEEMSMHAGERPKLTAEVVQLQNYLTECKEERIVKLKDEIKKAAERVIFLLYHAHLDGKSPLEIHFSHLISNINNLLFAILIQNFDHRKRIIRIFFILWFVFHLMNGWEFSTFKKTCFVFGKLRTTINNYV